MKMTDKELNEFMKSFTESFIKDEGFKNVVSKAKIFGKAVGELSKEEKTIAFFKALVEKDTVTLKTLDAVNNGGSYILPIGFVNDVIDRVAKAPNSIRALCRVINVKERTGSIPALVGGAVVKFATSDSDTNADKETNLNLGTVQWILRRIEGFNYLSKDLLNDSPASLYGIIADSYANALIVCENTAILSGLPANGEYEGVRTVASNTDVKTAGVLAPEDLIAMQYRIPASFRTRDCVYVAHTNVIGKLASMKDGNGQLLYNPNTSNGVATFCGYKIIEVTEMPTNLGSGTQTEIIFGNFGQGYVLFDKNEYATETNETIKWMENLIVCRFQNRCDGKVAIPSAFTRLTKVDIA